MITVVVRVVVVEVYLRIPNKKSKVWWTSQSARWVPPYFWYSSRTGRYIEYAGGGSVAEGKKRPVAAGGDVW